MTKPLVLEPLYEHGQHVLPIYAVGDRVARSSASLEEIKKRGGKRLRAPRGVFDKTRRASTQPQAYGWIKAIYPEAIEFTSMRQELEGMPMIQAAIGLLIGGGGARCWACGRHCLALPLNPFLVDLFGRICWLLLGWTSCQLLYPCSVSAVHGGHPIAPAVGRPTGLAGGL
ncbi:MAG: hypothetical protein KatS3mg122_0405 [Caldimonas sp.]|nr:MAG: hypothetical protein KatS3mg122_0405 [Caldimonas sp.]